MNIIPVNKNNATTVEPLLPGEVVRAIEKGLPVTAYAAVEDGMAVGALSGAIDEEEFELISIYVHPDYRGRGAGTALLERLTELLEGEDIPIRAEYTEQHEDDALLEFFLTKRGFEPEEEKLPCWYVGSLADLNAEYRMEQGAAELKAVSEVPEEIADRAFNGGLSGKRLDRECSSCIVSGDTVTAYISVEPVREGLIKIPMLYSSHPDPRAMMSMVTRTAGKLKEKYPPETEIAMLVTAEASQKLIKKVFSRVENRTRVYYRV